MPSDKQHTSFQELDSKLVIWTMTGVLIAIFMGALDQTIVSTAMPAIVKSLHGFGSYSGVITAYLIASTVSLPIGGKLSDVYGRKPFLIGGIIWFVIASVLCGFANSMALLIFFRALKGIGAGVMQAAANTTIADLFPPVKRGKAIGLVSTISVLSNVIGPLVGGYLTDGPGWRYIFFMNLPVGLIGCFVIFKFFPHVRKPEIKDFKIDYLGVSTMTAGVVPLLLALHHVGDGTAFGSFEVAGFLTMGILFLTAFLFVEKKARHPIVPLHIFKDPIISISLLNCGLGMAAMFGLTLFAPLFLQSVLGVNARTSGETLLPLSFTFAITATITGHIVGRFHRYKYLALAGATIGVIGAFFMTTLTPESSRYLVLGYAVLSGFGLAICLPIYNIAVQNAAPLNVLGVTTSMVYFVRSMSASIGVAVYGTLLTSQTKTFGLATALRSVFGLVGILMVVLLVATLFLKEIPLRKSNVAAT